MSNKYEDKQHAFRLAMMDEVSWCENREDAIHYSQSGSRDDWLWQMKKNPSGHLELPAALDCSSYWTYIVFKAMYEAIGDIDPRFDPSGYDWGAVGNSTSIGLHAKKKNLVIPLRDAKKGDGPVWMGEHVALLVQRPGKKDLMLGAHLSSHGSEAGPYSVTLQASVAYQGVMPLIVKSWPL